MKNLNFTQDQITTILADIAKKEDGVQQILKMSFEAIMKAEREEHNLSKGDQSNGYRLRKTYGHKKILELRVPRSRNGNFYPLLLGLLREQEEESRTLAYNLYGAGLTTEQVGKIFGDVYGRTYSTSQVSRMFNYARDEVGAWLQRPLEPYYPIILIDATFIYTRRVDHVSKEAYYTIMGVKQDRTREVLSIVNFPTESSTGWESIFRDLKERGLQEVGLFICDSLSGIETSIWKHFSVSEIQLCTIHLQRNVQKHIKPVHKKEVSMDFQDVFRLGERNETIENGLERWKSFCAKWGKYYPSVKRMSDSSRNRLYFTYLGYDYRIQNMIYSTNWVERLNRDYKRTTRMRGALPSPESTILLLGYVAMNRNAYQRKVPKLNYDNNKFKWTE